MQYKTSLGLTATLALAANAFMIPSTMSAPETVDNEPFGPIDVVQENTKSLESLNQFLADSAPKTVELDCKGCSFDGKSEEGTSQLALSWSTSEDNKRLLMNDQPFEFFSFSEPSCAVNQSLNGESKLREVTFSRTYTEFFAADGTDASLIDFDLLLMEADGSMPLPNVDRLSLRILKDEQGRLTISDVIKVPANGEAASDATGSGEEMEFGILPIDVHRIHENVQLSTCPAGMPEFVCTIRQQMETMRNALTSMVNRPHGGSSKMGKRPCPGRKHHGAPASLKGGVNKIRPLLEGAKDKVGHHMHHHKHHRAGCFLHSFVRAIHKAIVNFVIPVLIGVAAGMMASFLGMVVGTGLAMLWIRCVRGGRRGNASMTARPAVAHADVDSALVEEKVGLMQALEETEPQGTQNEPLPVYKEREDAE